MFRWPDSLSGLFVSGIDYRGKNVIYIYREMLPQPKTQADFSSTLALCAKDKCRARPIKARSISKRNVCLSRLPFYRYNEIRETRTSSHRFKVL